VPSKRLSTPWRTDSPPAPERIRYDARLRRPLRIAQVVASLVSNAAEHGGGVVQVGLGARESAADRGRRRRTGLPAPVSSLGRPHRRGQGLAIAARSPAPAASSSRHGRAPVVLELTAP
jgi:hypothetical protein